MQMTHRLWSRECYKVFVVVRTTLVDTSGCLASKSKEGE
jgi:hypothetical protein